MSPHTITPTMVLYITRFLPRGGPCCGCPTRAGFGRRAGIGGAALTGAYAQPGLAMRYHEGAPKVTRATQGAAEHMTPADVMRTLEESLGPLGQEPMVCGEDGRWHGPQH